MNNYEIFLKIVSVGSISRAAEQLGYSQSSVSHALATLEGELGCSLLTRGRNGARLTSDGETLLPYISDIVSSERMLFERVGELKGLESGSVRVAAFQSVATKWLPHMISSFERLYPNIRFDVTIGTYREIEKRLSSGMADCGFVRIPTCEPFKTFLLREDPFCAVLPTNHKFRAQPNISINMLEGEPFIIQDDGDDDSGPVLKESGALVRVKYTAHDIYTVLAMVKEGLGVSVLSALATEDCEGVLRIPVDSGVIRKIGLAISDKPSCATKRFADHVKKWVDDRYKYL